MKVTIHQPEHLVWLGLIKKIADADIFVILDSVQFEKNYFQNRNKIKTQDGWMWLTVPVKKMPLITLIKDIEISYDQNWQDKYLKSLQVYYAKAPYFTEYYPAIEQIINKHHAHLADLNIELLIFLLQSFGVTGKTIVRSSSMGLQAVGGSAVCLEIAQKQGAHIYLAGPSGRDYLHLNDFAQAGIDVEFHHFDHPTYHQLHGDFLPYMASIDALFNLGPKAKDIL